MSDKVRRRFLCALFSLPIVGRRLVKPRRGANLEGTVSEAGREILLERQGHEIRLMCSDELRIEPGYREWISQLAKLESGATLEEVKRAIEHLPGFRARGQIFFPIDEYWQAMQTGMKGSNEWVHYCLADRETGLELLLTLFGQKTETVETDDPSVLVIHCALSPQINSRAPTRNACPIDTRAISNR
jgi:hypothetical protein